MCNAFAISSTLIRLSEYTRSRTLLHMAKISRNVGERTSRPEHVRPAKSQISLRTHEVWSSFSMGKFWIAKNAFFLHADNEDSNQNAQSD